MPASPLGICVPRIFSHSQLAQPEESNWNKGEEKKRLKRIAPFPPTPMKQPSVKMQPFCVVGGECKGSRQMRLKIASDWLLKMKPDVTATSVRASYRQEGRKQTRNKPARREPDSSQGKKNRIKEEVKKENMSVVVLKLKLDQFGVVNKEHHYYHIGCCYHLLYLPKRVSGANQGSKTEQ